MFTTTIRAITLTILCWSFTQTAGASGADQMRYDFGENGCGRCGWFVVVDGVMGGLSSGSLSVHDASMKMEGEISLENNGGFASLRTDYQNYDLSPYSRVVIKYRSSGHDFAMTLNNFRRFWQPRFKARLPNTQNEWSEVTIKFDDFKKMRFDEVLGAGPSPQELANIIRLGFISSEKKASSYSFEVASIEFK